MKNRKINLTGLILIILFVLGMLFASNYSSGKSKLATLCFSGGEKNTGELTKVLSEIEGVRTVFLDPKSELLTFRYDSSRLTLERIKDQLSEYGLNAQNLKSVKILKAQKKQQQEPTPLFKLDISPSSN